MPERIIGSVRQHVFFDEHLLLDDVTGKMVSRRFAADEGIASWWKAASTGGIPQSELERVQLLISHEYIERALMKSGLPYRQFGAGGIELPTGAHNLSLKIPNLEPGTPLYLRPNEGPWSHR